MFDTFISDASDKYNVPESWIRAVIETESSWNPNAYRAEPQIHDASYGLMQLLYSTANGLGYSGDAQGLYSPSMNIDLGTKLLGRLRSQVGDDFRRVYSAYNSGKPDRYLTSPDVAAHVQRAVEILAKYITEEAEGVVQVVSNNPEQSAMVGLLTLVLLWYWTGKRR